MSRKPLSRRPGLRRALGALLIVTAVVMIGVAALVAYLVRDQGPRFEARRSEIVATTVDSMIGADGRLVESVHLTASSGLGVELSLKHPYPATPSADRSIGVDAGRVAGALAPVKRPLVVLLGGHRTGRDAVHLIGETRGVLVAALSYPFHGNHRAKGMDVVKQVPAIRGAVLDTPPAIMLALDHLLARHDVDLGRVELVGVSLGAPFACIAGALDHRVSRVWTVHGSGGIYAPLEYNLRRQLGWRAASIPIAGMATVALAGSQLAPERWVGAIAPRPIVIVNASDDQRLPREAVERLFESAGEPKERIWTTGGHVRSEAEFVQPLVDLVVGRIVGADGGPIARADRR